MTMGTLARHLSPRELRPRSRAILVLTPPLRIKVDSPFEPGLAGGGDVLALVLAGVDALL